MAYSLPRRENRKVDLEDGLERLPVVGVLHQRRREGVLERLAISERDVLHRLHCIEVLGQADRQSVGVEVRLYYVPELVKYRLPLLFNN